MFTQGVLGDLAGCTRLLVSSCHMQLLHHADRIIVMGVTAEGHLGIVGEGKYEELMAPLPSQTSTDDGTTSKHRGCAAFLKLMQHQHETDPKSTKAVDCVNDKADLLKHAENAPKVETFAEETREEAEVTYIVSKFTRMP